MGYPILRVHMKLTTFLPFLVLPAILCSAEEKAHLLASKIKLQLEETRVNVFSHMHGARIGMYIASIISSTISYICAGLFSSSRVIVQGIHWRNFSIPDEILGAALMSVVSFLSIVSTFATNLSNADPEAVVLGSAKVALAVSRTKSFVKITTLLTIFITWFVAVGAADDFGVAETFIFMNLTIMVPLLTCLFLETIFH